jgi:hypothetical protein
MLLSLYNVKGELWEVAAGEADQNISKAKRANCYVLLVCYNLVALQHGHARRCKSFPPKGMTINANEHPDSYSAKVYFTVNDGDWGN